MELADNIGLLEELREMIAYTSLSRDLFFSNHASNYLPGKLIYPEGKVGLRPEWMRAL